MCDNFSVSWSEIAKEIQEDLSQVAKQLKDELTRGHPLLSSERLEIERSLILTPLLLVSAKMNRYDFSKLKPVGLALELLDLAVKRHYKSDGRWQMADGREEKSEVRGQNIVAETFRFPYGGLKTSATSDIRHPTSDINLALIAGDYYYAKALCLVAQLKDSRVIEILSQAVAFIAEGMAEESGHTDGLRKRASLYTAACHLGAYLSESDLETIELLKNYGENFGIAHQMIINGQESEQAKNFFEAARQALFFLPESSPRFYLANLLELCRGDL